MSFLLLVKGCSGRVRSNDIKSQQEADPKLGDIRKRVQEGDEVINRYYCIHNDTLDVYKRQN